MRRPVTGEVHVHYGQIYVESDPDNPTTDLSEAFAGQSGGLCGAAVPGALWMTTGLHTGDVGFCVEVHDEAPALDPAWEDVVEVSFRPLSEGSCLIQWGGGAAWHLGLAVTDYRVRYCARGMDEGQKQDTRVEGVPQKDSYLLQFWPAPPAQDRVVRQTAEAAAYWHRYARELPSPPTPEERAEAERSAREAEERAAEERRSHHEQWIWGGRLPSERLRGLRCDVRGLLAFDSDLVHTLDAASPGVQRAVALLAARRACEAAGLADVPWVADALTAVAGGRPLPSPFDDAALMWETLRSDPRVPRHRSVLRAVPPERAPYRPPARPAAPGATWVPVVEPEAPGPRRPGLGRHLGTMTLMASPGEGPRHAEAVLHGAGAVPDSATTPRDPQRISPPHFAPPAVLAAAGADPLKAALDAVWHAVATYGEHYPSLLEEIRSACAAKAGE
ncbi:hypothetical protein [Streptomyces sp. DW26H14]|uniref:hypothetical protein n=1 Tax=Streptomyces sp. DW26H14 TaxID=3435395 RepID=UPI00403DAE10